MKSLADLKVEWNGGAKAMGGGSIKFSVLRIPKEGKSLPSTMLMITD